MSEHRISRWLHGLRRRLPQHEQIFASRWLKPLAPWFDHEDYWALTRRKVAVAVAIGLFSGLMPGPTQMLTALLLAYAARTNLPVAMFTTLYSNPFTYLPLYYVAYELGWWVLGAGGAVHQPLRMPQWGWDAAHWHAFVAWLKLYGRPLLIGVPVLGSLLALGGYVAVRVLWRWRTSQRWRQRR